MIADMRFTVYPAAVPGYFVLEDTETGATWNHTTEASAVADRDRAERDPSFLRRRTAAAR